MTQSGPQTVRVAEPTSSTLYDLVEQIGEGGMGTVFRAKDRTTGVIVAVKLLKKDADAVRFAREVHVLAKLSHPNIVRYAGHGITEEGTQFVAMEWLEGQSLDVALRAGDVSLRRALEVARDVASALQHAHEQGVVHRDLKPSNIFLSKDGVKVLDFGVARFVGETGFTQTGQVVGTPSYMAPEQARGERDIGPSADLFSLGCVIYRCVAQEGPFTGPDVLAVLSKLATHDPARLHGVPRALGDLVAGLLAKDPAARPASAREVIESLERLLTTDLRPEPTPMMLDRTLESPSDTSTTLHERNRWLAAAVALGAAAVGAAIYIVATRAHPPRPPEAAATPSSVRATAERACRTWGAELARRQKSDGSFTGESHRDATGWDTAQELVALEDAKSCASVSPMTLRSATDALVKMRTEPGWTGPDRARGAVVSVAADAWATLALAYAARHDPRALGAAKSASDLLVSLQRPDGAFGYKDRADNPNLYASLVAAWALAVSNAGDPRKRAVAWLAGEFRRSSELRTVAGLEEQFLWVLVRVRREAPSDAQDEDVLRTGATDVIARCGLDRSTHACTRPLYDDGEIDLGTGKLTTLWHAWVGPAADALTTSSVALAPDVRSDLETIARWGASSIDGSIDALAALPEYKLAEYLMATTTLAGPH